MKHRNERPEARDLDAGTGKKGSKEKRAGVAFSPGRPVGTSQQSEISENHGESQATPRPVFIFAATSTEIRQPIAR